MLNLSKTNTVENIKKFVGNKGKLFSITFIKKNGEERKMVARLGVTKYLTGRGMLYTPENRNMLVVFSTGDNDYRTINISTLKKIKANGIELNLNIN